MPTRITPPEAAERLKEGFVYIDVRSIPEFESGHPEGALNVPVLHKTDGRMVPNADFQAVMEGVFAKDAQLVIGCRSGQRSLQACAILEAAGFSAILDMRGGIAGERDPYGRVALKGWRDEGLPVSDTPAVGATYEELKAKAGL